MWKGVIVQKKAEFGENVGLNRQSSPVTWSLSEFFSACVRGRDPRRRARVLAFWGDNAVSFGKWSCQQRGYLFLSPTDKEVYLTALLSIFCHLIFYFFIFLPARPTFLILYAYPSKPETACEDYSVINSQSLFCPLLRTWCEFTWCARYYLSGRSSRRMRNCDLWVWIVHISRIFNVDSMFWYLYWVRTFLC